MSFSLTEACENFLYLDEFVHNPVNYRSLIRLPGR